MCAQSRSAVPAAAAWVDAPRAAHPQVRVERQVAVEAQEEVLAAGIDRPDPAALEALRYRYARKATASPLGARPRAPSLVDVEGRRWVFLDDTWSAMMFRPAEKP